MCGEAIQEGLEEFNKGNYDSALDLFTSALELPGNGFMRMAGEFKPPNIYIFSMLRKLSFDFSRVSFIHVLAGHVAA